MERNNKRHSKRNSKRRRRKILYRRLIIILSVLLFLIVGLLIVTIVKNVIGGRSQEIETKYCNLYFPGKWEEQLKVEIEEDDMYVVEFYGKVEGKPYQHLFNVEFGDAVNNFIGTLETDEGNINVGYEYKAPKMAGEWSTEEVDTIYEMQDDIEYLLELLEKEDGFTAKGK